MARIPPEAIRGFAGCPVRVRLHDGAEFAGSLRTELLTAHSIAVYLARPGNEGVTLYIDQIAEIVPLPVSRP